MADTKMSADTDTEISAETDTETDNFRSLPYSIVYLSALNQTIDLLIDTLVYAIALADQLQHTENKFYLSGIILSL